MKVFDHERERERQREREREREKERETERKRERERNRERERDRQTGIDRDIRTNRLLRGWAGFGSESIRHNPNRYFNFV